MKQTVLILPVIVLLILLAGCSIPDMPDGPQLPVETLVVQVATETQKTGNGSETLQPSKESIVLPTPLSDDLAGTSPGLGDVPGIELDHISQSALDLVLGAHAHWVRRNALNWAQVEPEQGKRNWEIVAGLDQEIIRIAETDGELILVIRNTPTWAQKISGVSCGPVKEDQLAAFANFVRDVVVRYDAAPYNVRYFELGNEPDIDPSLVSPDSPFGCWGDIKDEYYGGGQYAAMLKQVYPLVKAAVPEAQILVGGLLVDCDPINTPEGKWCVPSLYLEGILKAGGGDYFDGISFHAYDYYVGPNRYHNPNWNSTGEKVGPVLQLKAAYLRRVLRTYNHPDKYLINTEAGLVCGRDGSEMICQTPEFMETKAQYAAEVGFAALSQNLAGNIWYSLNGWRGSALIDKVTGPNLAYQAYAFSSSFLQNASFVRMVTEYPGVRGYEIKQGGKRIWLLRSTDGINHTIDLPAAAGAVYDMVGSPHTAGTQVSIAAALVMIVWDD